ncbi:MAG: Nif3-like dinuclear metal center hexameric protein [Weeksellaceae bacterium]|nr:Nif3-like dinuclear metal center hexameric protein [Weeksellaceae bacterium]
MKTTLKELIAELENWAPKPHAEGFDNVGLLTGDANAEVKSVVVTLDVTPEVLEECVEKGANVLITFHPLIFSKLSRISLDDRVGKMLHFAIKNDIAIYAIHTNLDAQLDGVNAAIAQRIGLEDCEILIPKQGQLVSLRYFTPVEDHEAVRQAMFDAGYGKIGLYANCSFNLQGTGTFLPMQGADPDTGEVGKQEKVEEMQTEILLQTHQMEHAMRVLRKAHPYEEVAHHLQVLHNVNQHAGMGQIGVLPKPMGEEEFLQLLKKEFDLKVVRHSRFLGKEIRKVAVLGGSGAFALQDAIRAGADAYVTADCKYHDFFAVNNGLLLCDVGHFESEQFTKKLIFERMSEKFANFAIRISDIETNPVNYFL